MTTTAPRKTPNELAHERTDLAAMRTMMAADRTLMAWVRTALSLQSFGFTIYKVLQALQEERGTLRRDQTPANVGLFLTAMGTSPSSWASWSTSRPAKRCSHFTKCR